MYSSWGTIKNRFEATIEFLSQTFQKKEPSKAINFSWESVCVFSLFLGEFDDIYMLPVFEQNFFGPKLQNLACPKRA